MPAPHAALAARGAGAAWELRGPAWTRANRPETGASSLDFLCTSLYLSPAPHWRHLGPALRLHEPAAQAAYQILWLPDERLRCATHGGHAGPGRLCRDIQRG